MDLTSVLVVFISLLGCETIAVFLYNNKIEWIKIHVSKVVSALQHPDGVEGGSFYSYICRTHTGKGIYGGKLVYLENSAPRCAYGKDGKEIFSTNFEVLSAPEGSLSWEEYNGKEPQDAVISGHNDWGQHDTSYVCRGWADKAKTILVIGYHTAYSSCFASLNKEVALSNFEILVKNEYGKLVT